MWPSPISAVDVARTSGRPDWPGFVGDTVCWTEPRPADGGRVQLVAQDMGELLPAGWSVRSRLIEYGGRPWTPLNPTSLAFCNAADQRIYRLTLGGDPEPLTPVDGRSRYGDLTRVGDEVWCVREMFVGAAPRDLRRDLVAVSADGVRPLAATHHFMTAPVVSPDSRRACWIGWDHPEMPWDRTSLVVAELRAGALVDPRVVASDAAAAQAVWGADGSLYAITDPGGWWNVHRVEDDGLRNVCVRPEEFGGAMWRIGLTWCAPLADGRLVVLHGRGEQALGVLDPVSGVLAELAPAEWAAALAVRDDRIVGVTGGPDRDYVVMEVGVGALSAPRPSADPAYLPVPERRVFDGVHAVVYPPRHPDHPVDASAPCGAERSQPAPCGAERSQPAPCGAERSQPVPCGAERSQPVPCGAERSQPVPYLVFVHGGPTSRVPTVLDLEIAYFTSRGFGVVEVEYGGSTGHGRAYRERLRDGWGVVDVADCATVVRGLIASGEADPARIAIRGGSAGGWTTAASLTAEPAVRDLYRCGVISYPILDLVGWRTGETHDFESRYLDSIVGPWPAAERRYVERSPVNRGERLRAPFLLLQGLADPICPPAQAERFLAVVASTGVPHRYLTFEGESHGFRREDTLIVALEAELELYAAYLA